MHFAFALSTPLRPSLTRLSRPSLALSPRAPSRIHPPNPTRMRVSFPHTTTVPLPFPFPRFRLSYAPLSEAARLQRVSTAVLLMYLPALALLLLRLLTPSTIPFLPTLSLAERLLLLALLVIAPELAHGSFVNLRHCAAVAVRAARATAKLEPENEDLPFATANTARRAERLVKPVRVHSVLTSVVAAGTLAGLFVALVAPASGAQVALLFQLVFYLARRVRFESKGKVYRCETKQYRDIVWTCAMASACVGAVQFGCLPTIAAGVVVLAAVVFWVLKWIFVPSDERIF